MAANASGEAESGHLRLEFDRSVKLAFQGSSISSDGGLLLHRELDDALGLAPLAADLIGDPRAGQNGRHRLAGLLRQSISSRFAGYEDVNDADRLRRDPLMRQLVGGRAVKHGGATESAMGRFEIAALTQPHNLAALTDLSGRWIDAVHDRRPPKVITLDMDSSEKPSARRAGGLGLERPFPIELPVSTLCIQSLRRSGALRSASRKHPQR